MLQCYNRGCGKTFDPVENYDESCQHHPGVPFFHDVYKGWSCCNKKSVDFTEFLNIKGCTQSKHSSIKPEQPEKQSKGCSTNSDAEQQLTTPATKVMVRPPLTTLMTRIEPIVAPVLKATINEIKNNIPLFDNLNDSSHGSIAIGTSCKNAGCAYSYSGNDCDDGECKFHPGVPIFHEGMKYWSCCQRKTSDFAVFMEQKGCAYGEHKWFRENDNKQAVNCRYDWHQTGNNVIVSIYAKLYDFEKSFVEISPVRLHAKLFFPSKGNGLFELDMELRGIINVSKAAVNMYASKVEITLPKAEPGMWPNLDFPSTTLPSAENEVEPTQQKRSFESEEDFDLDGIETVINGCRSGNENNL